MASFQTEKHRACYAPRTSRRDRMATLLEKIKRHDAKVAVIGIGYVGLPLCTEMARAGFHTTGYDTHDVKVKSVLAQKSYIGDIPDDLLAPLVHSGKLTAS